MKIHEYQAKAILTRHGVPVPLGEVVNVAGDAAEGLRAFGEKRPAIWKGR